MPVALYARVSTERQERQQTIDSQLAALRAWAVAQGHPVSDEHVFRDEGYSGSRLDRPGLDALRDAVRDGAVGTLVVLAPDRLARKYAYQVLLLEEFRRAGAEVVFLQHPISDDPNDQLLLQIQGAIAEYERAVLGERFRRGKLQKARDGHYITGSPAYGYSYVPRRDAVPGHIVVNEPEAELVRRVYGWFTDEQTTIRQVIKRLNAGPDLPRSGRPAWSASTVHHMLADPIYVGTAYANRYSYVPATKPRSPRGPRNSPGRRCLKPREQWIAIPVPALVDQGTWDRAQAQLARNAALSFRNNTRHSYLLRCLLTCEVCGLAMYGITRRASARKPVRQVYECHGKDCILSARVAACPSRTVPAEEIEPVVWNHVAGLLADPDQLLAQFDRFATAADAGSAREQAAEQQLRTRLDRTARADKRLLDAYQAGAISLSELSERRQHLAQERQALEQQQGEQTRLRQQRLQAEAVRTDVAAFCERIRGRLAEATLAEKQAILQLVIERIIVGDGRLEIRHVIPLRSPPPGGNGPMPPKATRLRTDGVHDAEELVGLDPIATLKPHLGPAFAAVMARLAAAVAVRYRLPAWTPAEHALHKRADRLAAASEARHTAGWTLADMRDSLDIDLDPLPDDPLLSRHGADLPAGTRPWEPWPARLAARLFLAKLHELDGAACPEATADLGAAKERQAALARLGAAFSRLPPRTRMRYAHPPTGNSLIDTFVYAEAHGISQQHVEGVVVDGERDEDGRWLLDGEFTVFTTDEELIRVAGWACDVQIQ